MSDRQTNKQTPAGVNFTPRLPSAWVITIGRHFLQSLSVQVRRSPAAERFNALLTCILSREPRFRYGTVTEDEFLSRLKQKITTVGEYAMPQKFHSDL